ncbi:MAG TPA: aspartate--tRNA(Asn) ligase [Acidimicrobiales bacterium]|nr:aspartate--tRNA(Asn) ligase [Acidimicrobiales bacterium]
MPTTRTARTRVRDLHPALDGRPVRLQGWLHHQRRLANVTFALVRDATGVAQVVVEDGGLRATLGGLRPETVIEVSGRLSANASAPNGVEVHEPVVTVLVEPAEVPPFELRRPELQASLPTILDHAAVALRHPARREAFRVAAASVAGFRATLDGLGFTEVHTPKLVGSATETGANVFAVDYFGRTAYLAQSPQLYKQVMVGVFERVYETGPVFRAEPHDTVRHLAQYTSLDVELGFIEDHRDVMALLRDVLAGMVAAVEDRVGAASGWPTIPSEIPVIHFDDAQALLERLLGEPVVGESDLAPAHERRLGEWAIAEHGSDLLFVEGYPMAKRPFYTHPDPDRPGASKSFDLLFRGLELVTGGQRLHRHEDYVAVLGAEQQVVLDGYLQAFRYGLPPHGGFAIGLERWVARLVGAANVRDVTLFPRDLHRLTP